MSGLRRILVSPHVLEAILRGGVDGSDPDPPIREALIEAVDSYLGPSGALSHIELMVESPDFDETESDDDGDIPVHSLVFKRRTTVWIVGVTYGEPPDVSADWELLSLHPSAESARLACIEEEYFYAPLEFGVRAPKSGIWPGLVQPVFPSDEDGPGSELDAPEAAGEVPGA